MRCPSSLSVLSALTARSGPALFAHMGSRRMALSRRMHRPCDAHLLSQFSQLSPLALAPRLLACPAPAPLHAHELTCPDDVTSATTRTRFARHTLSHASRGGAGAVRHVEPCDHALHPRGERRAVGRAAAGVPPTRPHAPRQLAR